MEPRTIPLTYNTSVTNLLRIPTDDTCNIEINYVLEGDNYSQVRRGRITIVYDKTTDALQVADDYEYIGTLTEETRITFTANSLVAPSAVMLQYTNNNTFDTGGNPTVMTYTYSVLS